MTVYEALGIDEKEVEKKKSELLKQLDINDFIDAHRHDMEMLSVIDEELDASVASFESGKLNREEIESVYAMKILVLLHMARRFHPLSAYGKSMLSRAVECRLEFEKKVGPLVTAITEKNVELFLSSLTPDLAEDISVGRRQAIGALRTVGDTTYGVGAIVFYKEDSIVYEGGILRVEWLYVNPDFRERGVAHHLLGEVLKRTVDIGTTYATVSYPIENSFLSQLTYLFGTWQFEMETGITPEALIQIKDITNREKISALKKGVQSFASLDESACERLLKKTLRKFSYQGFLLNPKLMKGYVDRKLSCFIGEVTDADGVLIAHRTPSGRCRMEYFNVVSGHDKDIGRLLCRFMDEAIASSKDKDMIEIPVEMEEIGVFLDGLCPKQMGMHLMEGFLSAPPSEIDMDEDDINQLINSI